MGARSRTSDFVKFLLNTMILFRKVCDQFTRQYVTRKGNSIMPNPVLNFHIFTLQYFQRI